jgi:hypothetical protein
MPVVTLRFFVSVFSIRKSFGTWTWLGLLKRLTRIFLMPTFKKEYIALLIEIRCVRNTVAAGQEWPEKNTCQYRESNKLRKMDAERRSHLGSASSYYFNCICPHM